MSDDSDSRPRLPASVSDNIDTVAEFYARHEQQVSTTQRIVEKVALFLGSPAYVAANILFIAGWIGANLLAEEKSSKIIQLLEELRRDMPNVRKTDDHEAAELAKPADPEAVLKEIERTHDEPYGEAGVRKS